MIQKGAFVALADDSSEQAPGVNDACLGASSRRKNTHQSSRSIKTNQIQTIGSRYRKRTKCVVHQYVVV